MRRLAAVLAVPSLPASPLPSSFTVWLPVAAVLLFGAALLAGAAASAGAPPNDYTPLPPTTERTPLVPALVTTSEGRACQEAVAQASRTFVGTKLAVEQSCLLFFQKLSFFLPKGTDVAAICRTPSSDATPAHGSQPVTRWIVEKAERRAEAAIEAACADEVVAGDLLVCGETAEELASCTLAQASEQVDAALDSEFGEAPPTFWVGPSARCQAGIAHESRSYLERKLAAVSSCLDERNRSCATGNAAEQCIGSFVDGQHVPPTDARAAEAIARAEADLRRGLRRSSCSAHALRRLDACADDPRELADCLVESHWQVAAGIVSAQYGGAEHFADETTGIGPVVAAAGPGETVLVDAGTYYEKVAIEEPDFTLIGQKTCEGDRPVLENPDPGNSPNGIFACGSLIEDCGGEAYGIPPGQKGRADRILIESLEIRDFDDNDVFVTGADGVTFRDLVTTGPGTTTGTLYGVFPVFSRHILVEDIVVSGVRDAGIYIGKDVDIIVRRNVVFGNVAGIEIENSVNAEVYGNLVFDNTGGILVFKDPRISFQESSCHVVRGNVIEDNNRPNFGSGFVSLVPSGTGLLVISNDSTLYEGNVIRGNDTFGAIVTEQAVIDAIFDAFGELSADQSSDDNFFVDNFFEGNGTNPSDPVLALFAADAIAVTIEGNAGCSSGNVPDGASGNFDTLPECPEPVEFAGCPFPLPDPFPQP